MPDDLELQLRQRIAGYIDPKREDQTLAGLDVWITDESWEADDLPIPARQLMFDALRLLSEYQQEGGWTEPELKERLGILSRTYWFEQAPKFVWSGADSSLSRHQEQLAAPDRSRVAESA